MSRILSHWIKFFFMASTSAVFPCSSSCCIVLMFYFNICIFSKSILSYRHRVIAKENGSKKSFTLCCSLLFIEVSTICSGWKWMISCVCNYLLESFFTFFLRTWRSRSWKFTQWWEKKHNILLFWPFFIFFLLTSPTIWWNNSLFW